MFKVMVMGAGKIGSLIACLLAECKDYEVHLGDNDFNQNLNIQLLDAIPKIKSVKIDIQQPSALQLYLEKHEIDAVISSLPYFLNPAVARAAKLSNCHYFDLTEDTKVSEEIRALAKESTKAFVPQCGLAPGFISIAANSLLREFEICHHANLRVGAIPQRANNELFYSLTWSTDGLINEYGNLCQSIEDGKLTTVMPLEGLESLELDGCAYEAFNTSGGLGSLGEIYLGKITTLNYKTIRYPGHCHKIRFLMNDLKLNDDRATLKRILENSIAKTYQDVVLIYVTVEGIKNGELVEKSFFKKIYPKVIHNIEWSAIQVSTASGLCAVVDLVLGAKEPAKGLVFQENFKLEDILHNRFGKHFA